MATITISRPMTPAHYVAIALGIVFLAVGILGFTAPGLLGMHLSAAHNWIHLISGAASLYFGLASTASAARAFALTFGTVYGVLGLAGLAAGQPGTPAMPGMPPDSRLLVVMPGVLELGMADHLVHIVIGAAYALAGIFSRMATLRYRPQTEHAHDLRW